MNYEQARDIILGYLASVGWFVQLNNQRNGKALKVPHATAPDGSFRWYFKARSIHRAEGPQFGLGESHSTSIDMKELAQTIELMDWVDPLDLGPQGVSHA